MQIAKEIFLHALITMKGILDLAEFKLKKESTDFKYFKQETMNKTYDNLNKLFKKLTNEKILEKCECGASLRKGYCKCGLCGGSGFTNLKIG